MSFFESLNDIRLLQSIAMVVAASLAIVMLLIKVPRSEHSRKLTRAKDIVAFSYMICAFIFGYTLYHNEIEDYEVFSAITMLINVSFSSATLGYSLINLLNYRNVELSKLLISIFAIFLVSIALVDIFFFDRNRLFKVALITGIVLFCALCIYYIIIFDKWYKQSVRLLEKYYDEDEDHKLKWIKFCFILAMLTDMFILVYLLLPRGMIIFYIGFYILFLLYFASNFISFLGSHKLLLDAFGHWTIRKPKRKKNTRRTGKTANPASVPEVIEVMPVRTSEAAGTGVTANENAEKSETEISSASLENALDQWVREKRYREYDKSREEIAAELGTTKELLHQYFIVNKGVDFRTWRTELRIEDAKKLLLEDKKLSTNIIGEIAGFSDRSNFHRQFTKIVGCSPKQWRESDGKPAVA